MKKGIFICEEFNELPGIKKKILSQVKTLESCLGEVVLIKINYNFFNKIKNKLPFFSSSYTQISDLLNEINDTDYIYIRKPSILNRKFIMLLNQIKKLNPKIVLLLEVPTFPYDNEVKLNIKNFFSTIKDRFWRNKLDAIDRIVTFSNDRKIFNIETIQISNGVDFKNVPLKKNSLKSNSLKSNSINLIGVASISHWHGYDRVIEGLKLYLDSDPDVNVIFNIVGDGNPKVLNDYKEKVSKYNLTDNVVFHGKLTGNKLNDVFDLSDIGVDALGRHRSKIFYNSSLKGKEYLARGLPIISGVRTELDDMHGFPAYLRIPANDSPVDIYEVKNFFSDIIQSNIDARKIRSFGEKKFDFYVTMKPIIQFIDKL